MNAKLSIPFLSALLASGCIINGGHPRNPGDVTFTWSFYGQTCSQVPEVAKVRIAIPGERLQNDGIYPCTSNSYPGIVLHDFRGGEYGYTIEGLSYTDEVLYTASGEFTVDGNARVTVDLTPVGGPSSWAYISWRFPNNPATTTCAQAQPPNTDPAIGGIAYVDVEIDGTLSKRFHCAEGSPLAPGFVAGIQTPALAPGSHTLKVTALLSSLYPVYTYSGTFVTTAGTPISNEVPLAWAVGGVNVKWTFTQGSTVRSCADVGNPNVYVQFVDVATGYGVYANPGDLQACDATVLGPKHYFFLRPGTYDVVLTGVAGNTNYVMVSSPPRITIPAGAFPADADSLNIVLRQQ
jgi:hypothetical protein